MQVFYKEADVISDRLIFTTPLSTEPPQEFLLQRRGRGVEFDLGFLRAGVPPWFPTRELLFCLLYGIYLLKYLRPACSGRCQQPESPCLPTLEATDAFQGMRLPESSQEAKKEPRPGRNGAGGEATRWVSLLWNALGIITGLGSISGVI